MYNKISIIVPIYNTGKYLRKCIDSLINQTYKNLEIILVDDGSTDKSKEIIEEYLKIDPRIKPIYKENGGLSDARNIGLQQAKGKYIGFVDSDDFVELDMYEKMLGTLKSRKADMVVCNYAFVNENGEVLYKENIIKDEELTKKEAYKKLIEDKNFYYVTAVNKLYKSDIFKGLLFPVGKIHEDEFIIHHILSRCNKIVTIKEYLYLYVQREGSIMNSNFSVKKLDGIEAYIDRAYFFRKERMRENVHFVLKQSYALMLDCIRNLPVIKYKKRFNTLIWNMLMVFKLDLRMLNIILIYEKKYLTELIKQYMLVFKIKRKLNIGRIFLMATPTHGNLGDQAIVKAEYNFLTDIFPNREIIEIRNCDYIRFNDTIQCYINEDDIIVIDGGGNLGTLWPEEDDKISDIIIRFKNNRVIVFPQTVYYDIGGSGINRLQRNISIYKQNKNLIMMFREKRSMEFIEKYLPNLEKFLVPDIVLTLNEFKNEDERKGIIFCFRNDCEKVVSDVEIDNLKKYFQKMNFEIKEISTVINVIISKKNRDYELEKKWNEFRSAELVITDRLHGMLFAAITGTPCIALDNKSKKVSGVYEWIRELEYIKCADNFQEIYNYIEKLLKNKKINWKNYKEYYDLVIKKLKEDDEI